MPQYEFVCHECKTEFHQVLTLAEFEGYEETKEKLCCPKCGSLDVEQAWTAFFAVTSKKS
jgi:putative FmdB family regulatory protein